MNDSPSGRPRLLLAVHQGFSVRYLLQTDMFSVLRREADLVILCQDAPEEFSRRFASENIEVASIDASESRAYRAGHRLEQLLGFIRHYVHAGHVQTTEDHYQIAVRDGALLSGALRTRLLHRCLRGLILLARRSHPLRRLILWFESKLYVPAQHMALLKRYRPDMVVTTSLGTFDYDQYVMRAARRLRIPVTTVVLSWDNTTARGYPGAQPDFAIAWTDAMKDELEKLNDLPRGRAWTEGVAHFDPYYRPDPTFDRSAFLQGVGLDPDGPVILVATKSPNAYAFNPDLARMLAEAVERGDLPANCQVLIRIHPLHYRFTNGEPVYANLLQTYRDLAAKHPSIHLNEPSIESAQVDYDMADDEMLFLTRLLRSTSVLVNIFSTMNIEGAIFDIPLVNVSFEGETPMYPAETDSRFDILIDWRATHNQRLLATSGCRTVWNDDELIVAVRDYLADPARDAEGRKRIVEQEAGPNPGNAGTAIAERLLMLTKQATGTP